MEHKLPCDMPPITSYPSIANSLSVLWSHKEVTMSWLASEYIQLVGRKREHWKFKMTGTFYEHGSTSTNIGCPFLETLRLNREVLAFNHKSFYEFVKYCVDNNYYIHVWLDWFYIPKNSFFKTTQRIHPTFIYGYDDIKNEVIIRDFFDGKYKEMRVLSQDLEKSYDAILAVEKRLYMTEIVTLYKYRETEYNINLQKIIRDYQDYINSEDGYRIYKNDNVYATVGFSFGISYYDVLDHLIKEFSLDIRSFHVLVDHKIMQIHRIKYLHENGHLHNGELLIKMSEELKNDCEILRNRILKLVITEDKNQIEKLVELNAGIKIKDKLLAKNIYANIII